MHGEVNCSGAVAGWGSGPRLARAVFAVVMDEGKRLDENDTKSRMDSVYRMMLAWMSGETLDSVPLGSDDLRCRE